MAKSIMCGSSKGAPRLISILGGMRSKIVASVARVKAVEKGFHS